MEKITTNNANSFLKLNILLILYLILNSKLMKTQKNIIPLFLIQIHIK